MSRITVNGVELYYEVIGDGPPILFIHGLGSSTRDWGLQVEFFSPHHKVTTFDVRGHGKSQAPPGPYSVPLFALDTAELMETLKITPAHVVGISMGGMIAFQLAIERPELVRSLVIINSSPELVIRTSRDRLQVLQRRLIVQLLGMRKMGEVLGGRLFPKDEQLEIRKIFIERWAENDPRAYKDAMNALVGWSVSNRLHEIKCPVLVVAADQDYTPVEFKQAYVEKIPGAELVVIEDSHHATTIDQPDKLNQVLNTFLSNLD